MHADSAGIPFEGRAFEPNPAAGDDGSADPRLLEALRRFRAGDLGQPEVLDALRTARLLAPLVAERGDEGVGAHGQLVDKTQELAIVTVAGPDGRPVLPMFTSVAALAAWDPRARPIPVESRRVALAAAGEGTDRIILDPTSPTEFGLRLPALRALATDAPWTPCWDDDAVLAALRDGVAGEPAIRAVGVAPGDPDARLVGVELAVRLTLAPGLDRDALDALLARVQAAWAADPLLASRVASMSVALAAAAS